MRVFDFLVHHKNDPMVASVLFIYWANSEMLGVELRNKVSIRFHCGKHGSYATDLHGGLCIRTDLISVHNILNTTFLKREHERVFSKFKGVQKTLLVM